MVDIDPSTVGYFGAGYEPTETTAPVLDYRDVVGSGPMIADTTPTISYDFEPLVNPLGLEPAGPREDSFLQRRIQAGQLGLTRDVGLGATGAAAEAEALAPRNIATVGYGPGQVDPGLARGAGLIGATPSPTDYLPFAYGDPNAVTAGMLDVREGADVVADRIFRNMTPEQQANLTSPIFPEEGGINWNALGAKTEQALYSAAPTVGAFLMHPVLGYATGTTMGIGDPVNQALNNVRQYAAENNLTPAQTSALESRVLEYGTTYAPAAALTSGLYNIPSRSGLAATGGAMVGEAGEEGFAQPNYAQMLTQYAITGDPFNNFNLTFDTEGALLGAITGGIANVGLGGSTTTTQGPTPAQTPGVSTAPAAGPTAPAAPNVPATIATPGTIQVPGTDVVVNTAPVAPTVPMTQAPTMQAPAPLGTGGIFQPGMTQQGPIITPPPARPSTPALPSPATAAETITALNEIQAEVTQTGALSAERAQQIADKYNLSMQEVANLAEQEMGMVESVAQQPVPRSTLPTTPQQTGIATVPTALTTTAGPEATVEEEILDPERPVSTEVTPEQEGVIIDQTVSRDLTVPQQTGIATVPTAPETTTDQTTRPLILVSTATDEPVLAERMDELTGDEGEDLIGGEGDEEIDIQIEPDENDECPPPYIRKLVDGVWVCVLEEEEALEEEEEPEIECPPGYRKVQMPNGGFTCVPELARPTVGPRTGEVSVAQLEGYTPYRPGSQE